MNIIKTAIIKTQTLLIFITVLIFMGFILIFPEESKHSVKSGLIVCGEIIIPSLFPFICAAIFIYLTKLSNLTNKILKFISMALFKVGGELGTVILMSLIGGFPVGAKLISKLYDDGKLTKNSVNTLLMFCVNGGPGFIIVAVGLGMLRSQKAGIIIFVSSVISTIIIGAMVARIFGIEYDESNQEKVSYSEGLIMSISDTGYSMLGISFFVIVFSSISACLSSFLPEFISKTITAFFEVTNGALLFSKNGIVLTAFIIGFSGIAVHFQVFSICRKITLNYKRFYIGRFSHAFLTAILAFIIEKIFPVTKETGNFTYQSASAISSSGASLSLIIMSGIMMFYVYMFFSEQKGRKKYMQ